MGKVKTYFLRVHTAELTEQIDEHRLEIRKLFCCVLLGLLEGAVCLASGTSRTCLQIFPWRSSL